MNNSVVASSADMPLEQFQFGLSQRLYNWTLREARQRLGLTQRALGNATGINKSMISGYEVFRLFPAPNKAEAIARVLGVPSTVLFPLWLKEFHSVRAPRVSEEQHFTLDEALASPKMQEALTLPAPENDWVDEIAKEELKPLLMYQP